MHRKADIQRLKRTINEKGKGKSKSKGSSTSRTWHWPFAPTDTTWDGDTNRRGLRETTYTQTGEEIYRLKRHHIAHK